MSHNRVKLVESETDILREVVMAFDPGWLQPVLKRTLGPLSRRIWDIDIIGESNIPSSGPALIAPNHIAFIDSIFMAVLLEREAVGVGKAEYMDSWRTRYLLPAVGMIPLDRSGGEASEGAMGQADEILAAGRLFVVFPEGTRSRDGHLHRGHTGAARLALKARCPIIPVGISGTDAIQPVDKVLPKTGVRAEIRIGKPISTEPYVDSTTERGALLRQITDEVMTEISGLSGQTYVDWYFGEEPS